MNELVARARRRETTELRILTDTPRTSAAALCQASGLTQLGDDELEIDRHLGMNLGRSS